MQKAVDIVELFVNTGLSQQYMYLCLNSAAAKYSQAAVLTLQLQWKSEAAGKA